MAFWDEWDARERQRERRRVCAWGRVRVVRIGAMSDSRRINMFDKMQFVVLGSAISDDIAG